MCRTTRYHAQADHARRLADITLQPNLEEVLRRVAKELDDFADDIVVTKPIFAIQSCWPSATDS
jgi:hypothetical protein